MATQSRRMFIKNASLAGASIALIGSSSNATPTEALKFILPVLPYSYDELAPYIDKLTMEIHHSKHHMAYVNKLNEALLLEDVSNIKTIEQLLANVSKYKTAIRNNGGGHYNHSLFWEIIKPNANKDIPTKLLDAINASFGTLEEMKKQFTEAATKRFGSGWAWLVDTGNKLEICSTANQDNPLMDTWTDANDKLQMKGKPLMAIDVWEHAYYLQYQNKRADYIAAWWNVVNWTEVAGRL